MLFGILGKKGAGKDTVSDYLVAKYGFRKRAIAAELKKIMRHLFHFKNNQLHGELKEVVDDNWDITPRHGMQFVGTLVREHFGRLVKGVDKNFWLVNLEMWLNKCKNEHVILSDCRYQNEVDFVKSHKGIVIKIVRNKNDEIKDTHESEQGVDFVKKHDILIENNGSLQELYKKIDVIMNEFYIKKSNGFDNNNRWKKIVNDLNNLINNQEYNDEIIEVLEDTINLLSQ